MMTKKEFKDVLFQIDNSFIGIHKNAALFYGHKKENNLNILEYYFYDFDNNKILKYNVFIKKDFIFSDKYLTFRFKRNKLLNKNINWKILKKKTIFNRFLKSFFLFNNFLFNGFIVDKELINVDKLDVLYHKHLEEIKKQFVAFQLSKQLNISYEYTIKNYDKVLKGKIKNFPLLDK